MLGYICLRNRGTYPIELLAQKRRSSQHGASFILQPGRQETFDYKGHWCIQVRGEAADIELLECEPTGIK